MERLGNSIKESADAPSRIVPGGGNGDVQSPTLPILSPRRMPGPAEAGLLFSLMAFLQLYAGQLLARAPLSDTMQIALSEVIFIAIPPLLMVLLFRYDFAGTFRIRLPRLRDVGMVILLSPVATLAAYSAGILAIVLVRIAFGTMQISGGVSDVMSRGIPIAVMTIGVFPAVCEELMFRGFLQRGMEGLGGRKAVVLSGLMFGLFHFDFQRLAAQALLGLVIAYVVYRSGSILNGMLIHFLHNAGSVLLTGVAGGLGVAATGGLGVVGTGGLGIAGNSSFSLFLSVAADGDIFKSPLIQEYLRQSGIPLDQMLWSMAIGSAAVLVCVLVALFGLLLVFRHITRDIAKPPRESPTPRLGFITAIPGLTLIMAIYAAIGLSLLKMPAGEFILRILHVS